MKKQSILRKKTVGKLADPETLLKAAKAAPKVFHIAAYFYPLYVMREKGYSWRYLADWLGGFGIEVSHVHLHRLYLKEDGRLSRLNRKQLLEIGMPLEMIQEREEKADPSKRLIAPDIEDEPEEGEDEQP